MHKKDMAAGFFFASLTILIWGNTYIVTKTLLNAYTPLEILAFRFSLAYLVLWAAHPRRPVIRCLKDELFFLALGLTGITLYFSLEAYALHFSDASNIGFIISTNPLITALIAGLLARNQRLGPRELGCYLLSLGGVFLIMFKGFNLELHSRSDLWGGLLALSCATVWAVYSLLTPRVAHDYERLMVVRKTFFYGLATMTLLPAWLDLSLPRMAAAVTPWIVLDLLFLACFASVLGFLLWNLAIHKLGAVRTSTFIYVSPLITMVSSRLVLKEEITCLKLVGGLLILGGVFFFQRISGQKEPAGIAAARPKIAERV